MKDYKITETKISDDGLLMEVQFVATEKLSKVLIVRFQNLRRYNEK